jgi:glyoxylase-like metal-dependent hydrolase (beta-lactamase superfamily II)
VFVVDSGFLPATTEADIAQIRQWTDKPVRYLMLTHGHTDHTTGTGAYARAFPGLTIVAHRETRNLMARYTPGYAALFTTRTEQMQKTLDAGVDDSDKPMSDDDRTTMSREIEARKAAGEQFRTRMGDNPLPDFLLDRGTTTFDLGGREVEVKFLGRGNTAGDLVAFIPRERIAVVGDILVHPLPYTCSGFPVDWVTTLDNVAALSPTAIVPGHGEVLHDLVYLHTIHDMLQTAIEQVDSIFQQIPGGGQSSLEAAQKAVNLDAFRDRIPPRDQYNRDFFGRNVPNCIARNVYYQLAPR